jgi:hypothetical protein
MVKPAFPRRLGLWVDFATPFCRVSRTSSHPAIGFDRSALFSSSEGSLGSCHRSQTSCQKEAATRRDGTSEPARRKPNLFFEPMSSAPHPRLNSSMEQFLPGVLAARSSSVSALQPSILTPSQELCLSQKLYQHTRGRERCRCLSQSSHIQEQEFRSRIGCASATEIRRLLMCQTQAAITTELTSHIYEKTAVLWKERGADRLVLRDIIRILDKDSIQNMHLFSPANICSLFKAHTVSDLSLDAQLSEAILSRAADRMEEFDAECMSRMFWSLATLKEVVPLHFVEGVRQRSVCIINSFNVQQLCAILWSFARLRIDPGSSLLDAFKERAIWIMGEFHAQSISQTLWAFAKLQRHPGKELLSSLKDRALWTIGDFNSQGISNTLWALATLRESPGQQLLTALTNRAVFLESKFTTQGLANMMWSFASLGQLPSKSLLQSFEERALHTANKFKPQEMANILCAYANMGIVPSAKLLDALASRALERVDDFNSQGMYVLVYTCIFDLTPFHFCCNSNICMPPARYPCYSMPFPRFNIAHAFDCCSHRRHQGVTEILVISRDIS